MRIIEVLQGSTEWLDIRAKHFCASDAAAMMGASKYTTRNDLLRQKATGIVPEVDAGKQRLFDAGHAAEDSMREHVEAEVLDDELFPTVAEDDVGYLLASYDGITMDGKIGWEHKLWSEQLAAQVRAGELEPAYYWQLEQQILIAGLEKIVFTVSDGTQEKCLHMEYRAVPGRAKQLMAGWFQFAEDMDSYQHQEAIPAAVAEPIKDLPALTVEIRGSVTASNLAEWRTIVTERIESINTDLQTDQHFADAADMVKFLDNGEKRIDLVKSQAQAQATDIDAVFRALDDIKATMRGKRLTLGKLVTARKENIKDEIIGNGRKAFSAHILSLSKRICMAMPDIPCDFAGAIKGKHTIESLRDAVDTLLAAKKIEASAIADRIQINLNSLRELAADHPLLFADKATIVLKANDDLVLLIKSRIYEHKADEDKRLADEREKIRQEEEAKAQAKVKAEADAAAAKAASEASATLAMPQVQATVAPPAPQSEATVALAPVRGRVTQTPAPDTGARINLGTICTRLEFTVTAEFLAKRGFPHIATEKSAKPYRASDFPAICASIIQHIEGVADTRRAARGVEPREAQGTDALIHPPTTRRTT